MLSDIMKHERTMSTAAPRSGISDGQVPTAAGRPGGRAGRGSAGAVVAGLLLVAAGAAAAAEPLPGDTAAPPQEATSALPTPALSPTLKANPSPARIDLGPFGPIYATGILSGLGYRQDNPSPGDRRDRLDLSNGQMFLQSTEGPVQFYLQTGVYKIPSLGALDRNAIDTTRLFFGPVGAGYLKFAPTDSFSVIAGKLPTLIGGEGTFTFQNYNIQRGLLFNQTNGINRGVQANYTSGPLTFAASLNDGFYSDRWNWASGSVTWKIDGENTLVFDAGANLGRTAYQTVAAPLLQNNSSIYNLIYTYSSGPWNLTPYLQYSHVPRDQGLGIAQSASTYGAALLASYALTPDFALAGRVEYIAQSGERRDGVTSLLYGPGSSALSFTFTPTYQRGVFFARAEYSYVQAFDTTPGLAFGRLGDRRTQSRYMLETGILF